MEIIDLLTRGIAAGASDLHLSAGLSPMVRVDGELHRLDEGSVSDREIRAMLGEVMHRTQREAFGQSLEADFVFEASGVGRFRVNAYHHNRGAGAAFRVIPSNIPTLAELNLAPVFEQIAMAPRGLVLVTGPTGSGKSTTLAAMIDCINTNRQEHILSIEDPIEFVHASRACLVTQREVLRDTASFNAALRSALDGDLDRVRRCVKLGVFVQCVEGFDRQPEVANSASDLMLQVFGEAGRHARFAVGANALPRNVTVEIDAIFEID